MSHRSLCRALGLVLAAGVVTPLAGQTMGSSTFSRYNFAYHAVPKRSITGEQAKATIPIPLGIFQVLRDSTVWDVDSSYYNPVQLVNYILHPPLYLEIKRAPAPTNDVEFFIGKNELIVDLGESQKLIPDDFGIGASVRPFSFGIDIGPVNVGMISWIHNDVSIALGDSLRGFLKDAVPAQPNTRYHATLDGLLQGGIAPQVGFARRVYGDTINGVYVGAVARYYIGLGYMKAAGEVGLTTGDTIFSSATPVVEDAAGHTYVSDPTQAMGTGFGGDLGVVWVRGPLELGVGINDIGATITWSKTDADTLNWDGATDQLVDSTLGRDIETTTQIPVSTLLHAVYGLNGGATVLRGGALINDRGAFLSASAEQRISAFALRGGIVRDQRQMMQFTWGGGVRFGPVGLDINFFTHSRSISEERGITMATSLSIY